MLAHVTLVPLGQIEVGATVRGRPSYRWVQGYGIRILASYTDAHKRGEVLFESSPIRLKDARNYCHANGLDTCLPSIGQIEACTRDKSPHFFTRSNRRFHDRSHGASALRVVRGADGAIMVTNGRSSWEFTGDDLRYSH